MALTNLHLRSENLQLSEDVLLYPEISRGSESHHWNRGKLLTKHIHSFVILTEVVSPLVGKKTHCFSDYVNLHHERSKHRALYPEAPTLR